jgi:hypothetical protein
MGYVAFSAFLPRATTLSFAWIKNTSDKVVEIKSGICLNCGECALQCTKSKSLNLVKREKRVSTNGAVPFAAGPHHLLFIVKLQFLKRSV